MMQIWSGTNWSMMSAADADATDVERPLHAYMLANEAQQHAVQDVPDAALVFLLGSRYCETDRLSEIA